MGENTATMSTNNRHQVGDTPNEVFPLNISRHYEDEDSPKRTGTLWTATANITTNMVGMGLLLLTGGIAPLGWIAGPVVVLLFSFVGYYTSCLLSNCYRTDDPDTGKRNSTYMDSVHSILGGPKAKACGFLQYTTLFGGTIRCIVNASMSLMMIKYMNCDGMRLCNVSGNPYMIMFGITEILLSQIPDFGQIWWLCTVAAVMFVIYSLIYIAVGIAQVAANGSIKGSLTVTSIWSSFQALGCIATAYSFSEILIEIQDTIKSPPSEAKTMKKAISLSTVVITTVYVLCGCMSYAAFGDAMPEKIVADMVIKNVRLIWLLNIANVAVVINLIGVYQVNSQPIFTYVEKQADQTWPHSKFISKEIKIPVPGMGQYNVKLFRLVWRTVFVILTTIISMLFPFIFNDIVDILSLGFWPLMVYFPVEMYIRQKKITKWSTKWVCLQMLSMACLVISIMATVGSIPELKNNLNTNHLFGMSYRRMHRRLIDRPF